MRVRIDPLEGFDASLGLKNIRWNAHISGMEVSEELNFKLQGWIDSVDYKQSFVIGEQATSLLEVGSTLKLVGFAEGATGQTVYDEEVI